MITYYCKNCERQVNGAFLIDNYYFCLTCAIKKYFEGDLGLTTLVTEGSS